MTLSARPLRLATTDAGFDAALKARLHWSADTDAGIEQAIRSQGSGTTEVEAVVLETDGTFSVIRRVDADSSVLEGVSNAPPEA